MRARRVFLAASCLLSVVSSAAFGQSALDRLEQDVRGQLGQPPAAVSAEPGYVGIIADDRQDRGRGVRVLDAAFGGPAQKAGVRANDLIVEVDGRAVRSMEEFIAAVSPVGPGQRISIVVDHAGLTTTIDVVLGKRPAAAERPYPQFGQQGNTPPAGPDALTPGLGLRVAPIDPLSLDASVTPPRGAVVVEVAPGSPAYKANVPVGAVITAVDGRRIDGVDDFTMLANTSAADGKVRIAYFNLGVPYERDLTIDTTAMTPPPGAATPPLVLRPPENPLATITRLEEHIQALEARIGELERRLGISAPGAN